MTNLDLFYKINKYYGIIDYTNFYNDGISKKINFKYEFLTYLSNEKIRKKNEKKEKEDNKDTKQENKEEPSEDMDLESEEEDEILNQLIQKGKKEMKIRFCFLDYMWLFNPAAKNEIILLFNEK